MLRITTFGYFAIHADGVPIHGQLGRQARELAAFLFTRPNQTLRREALLAQFWPYSQEHQARQALNNAIWGLRRAFRQVETKLGRHLICSVGDELSFSSDACVSIDVCRFGDVIEAAWKRDVERNPCMSDPDRCRLADALTCYNGSFLAGYDSDWVLPLRTRFETLFCRGQIMLMRESARSGDLEEAISCARSVLEADPFRENTQCDLMRLYILNGQRAAAIRQYNLLHDLLRQEFAVEPMPAATDLRNRIIDGKIFENLESERQIVGIAHDISGAG